MLLFRDVMAIVGLVLLVVLTMVVLRVTQRG